MPSPEDGDRIPSEVSERRPRRVAEAFRRLCDQLSRLLPSRLSRTVDSQLIGYAIVNSATFALDLMLLTALRDGAGWPVPATNPRSTQPGAQIAAPSWFHGRETRTARRPGAG